MTETMDTIFLAWTGVVGTGMILLVFAWGAIFSLLSAILDRFLP